MKDASSTDVIVHRGIALTSFYQCGDLYRLDPYSGNTLGKETWNGHFPFGWGVSAHPKVDSGTGELLFFNYSKQEPYMHYGVVDQNNELAHYVDIPLPGPRLPHDMAFTENYAILNDFPLFWDPRLLEHNVHLPRFYPDMPSRFAVIRAAGLAATSAGSKRNRRSCCTSPTPTKTATRSCSTASTKPIRSRWTPAEPSGRSCFGSWRWIACKPGYTGGASTWSPAP
ncbi:hypothetical protein NIIDMKKI_09990 [Mycobacterium kansasii]|uniref:Dioxygenase n=1 Tax=Mycobacterium kansasii TaxID=1768 RepID=A0A7G1I680_MYCKA|nr:hypothetical protein NIIDMKKI_09990 [Mycobacterium kansasii]